MRPMLLAILLCSVPCWACSSKAGSNHDDRPNDRSPNDRSPNDRSPNDRSEDPGAALALEAAGGASHLGATRAGSFDIGDWKAYAVAPDPAPADYDDADYYLVDVANRRVLSGKDAVRLFLAEDPTEEQLARFAAAFLGRAGWVQTERPDEPVGEEQHIEPPAIEDGTLEYWMYEGSPSPTLYRVRVDLDTLEVQTHSIHHLQRDQAD